MVAVEVVVELLICDAVDLPVDSPNRPIVPALSCCAS